MSKFITNISGGIELSLNKLHCDANYRHYSRCQFNYTIWCKCWKVLNSSLWFKRRLIRVGKMRDVILMREFYTEQTKWVIHSVRNVFQFSAAYFSVIIIPQEERRRSKNTSGGLRIDPWLPPARFRRDYIWILMSPYSRSAVHVFARRLKHWPLGKV